MMALRMIDFPGVRIDRHVHRFVISQPILAGGRWGVRRVGFDIIDIIDVILFVGATGRPTRTGWSTAVMVGSMTTVERSFGTRREVVRGRRKVF